MSTFSEEERQIELYVTFSSSLFPQNAFLFNSKTAFLLLHHTRDELFLFDILLILSFNFFFSSFVIFFLSSFLFPHTHSRCRHRFCRTLSLNKSVRILRTSETKTSSVPHLCIFIQLLSFLV